MRQEGRSQARSEGGRRRRSNFTGRPSRAWRLCISSWDWATPARNTPGPGTMRVFCWSERLAAQWKCDWSNERKFNARIAKTTQKGGRKVLLKASSPAPNVHELERRDGGSVDGILPGTAGAGDGGGGRYGLAAGRHPVATGWQQRWTSRSLESIEQHLGTREFARLRIGIGRKDGARRITGHVLGRFEATETGLLEKVLERASGQVDCWLEAGLKKAMRQFNGVVDPNNE